jgi:CubicO group peptidase (beta-lactamase class C family)
VTARYPLPTYADRSRRGRLQANLSIVDEVFARTQLLEHMPGLTFGLVLDGDVVHTGSFGRRVVDEAGAPGSSTVYRIASMTKSFTAAATLLLRDESQLRLDDLAAEYVPELRRLLLPTLDSAAPTVRNLLQMNSGWPQDDPWADRQLYLADGAIDAITATGISYSSAPATQFEYSNYAYILLGRIIQAVSGVPAMQFISERLLRPLNMLNSVWDLANLEAAEFAPGYRYEDETWRAEEPLPSGGDVAAFAGLCSNITDLARWVHMFLDAWPPRDDDERFPLCRASAREMQTPMSPVAPLLTTGDYGSLPDPVAYAYGFGLQTRDFGGVRIVGHGGGLPGYGTHMLWSPAHGIGLVALSNVTYGGAGRACLHALRELLEKSAAPKRQARPANHLLLAQDGVNRLLAEWDDDLATELFADNFFLDMDRIRWRNRFADLRNMHGAWCSFTAMEPQNWLRGEWRAEGEHGWCSVWLSMAPTNPPRIQMLRISSVFPASEPLVKYARQILAMINGDGDDEWLAAVAANANVRRMRQVLASAAAHAVVYQLLDEVGGDGSTWAEFDIRAGARPARLEIHLDAAGRLANLVLARR